MKTKLNFWPGAALMSFVIDSLSGKRERTPGKGCMNAIRDIEAHRKAQTERLKYAEPAAMTRQQERQTQRRRHKMPVGISMRDWHRYMGYPV